jgi:hypothetical protein
MTPFQKKRVLQLAVPLLILLIAEKIHRGAGSAIVQISIVFLVVYCFINSDKSWARRILSSPKKWWQ